MILCQWEDFSTETETYTQERFEALIGDEFEAMMVDDQTRFPQYIWTVNHVVIVTKRTKLIDEVEFKTIPRNPVCE